MVTSREGREEAVVSFPSDEDVPVHRDLRDHASIHPHSRYDFDVTAYLGSMILLCHQANSLLDVGG